MRNLYTCFGIPSDAPAPLVRAAFLRRLRNPPGEREGLDQLVQVHTVLSSLPLRRIHDIELALPAELAEQVTALRMRWRQEPHLIGPELLALGNRHQEQPLLLLGAGLLFFWYDHTFRRPER